MTWRAICAVGDLVPGRGVCALVDGRDVALFLLPCGEVFALDDIDPYCRVAVLSRGLVGSRGDADVVFSPMYKQAFDLRTGIAVDDPDVRVGTYSVRVVDGVVEVLSAAVAVA